MQSLKSTTPQTVFERGYVGDTNGDVNYGRLFDDQYGNYLRQSGLEKLGRFAGNVAANTALEAIRGVGTLYELGKRGAEKIDNFSEGTSLNDTLFKINDKDDNDFANLLTQFADKSQNPFGEIYTKDDSTFDMGSASWWLKQGQSTLPTVLEFVGESAALGVGLGRAALKLGEFLNVGVKGAKALQLSAQGLTSYGVTKHESYMMAAQSYQNIYSDYLRKFESTFPNASEQDKLKAREDAKKAAADGANYVDTIYTALALPFNITGLNSIFGSKEDDIYDLFKTGAGANRQAKLSAYKQQVENLSLDNPYVQKALGKKAAYEEAGVLAREAGFEGIEELEGQFAQESGENKAKGSGSDLSSGLGELKNFFKYTMNEEGALNFFMGSFMGGMQTAVVENIPIHKVDKLNSEGNVEVKYENGKPIVQTQYVNSRTRDEYGKQAIFRDYKDAILHDINHITTLQNQIKNENDPVGREDLKRELFHIQALDSVEKGLGENFINSIKEITDIDNTKSIAEPLLGQIEELQKQIVPSNQEGISEEQQAKNDELTAQINQLNKQYVENKDVTAAVQAGLAKDNKDNEYKRRGVESVNEIQQIQKFYDENSNRFSEQEKELGLHKLATKLQADILGRERIARDHEADIIKEKANTQLFNDIAEIATLDDYMSAYQYEHKKNQKDELVKALEQYDKSKDSSLLKSFVDESDKDVWNDDELAKVLTTRVEEKNKELAEENERLETNIRNLSAYQNFATGKEDSRKTVQEFLTEVNKKGEGLSNLANLNANLQDYKSKTELIKKHLIDILSDKGKRQYKAKALERLASMNKLLVDDLNTFTYEQAKKENRDNFYINKLKNIQIEQIEAINLEVKKIEIKIEELRTTNTNPSFIRAYYDDFLKKYIKAVNNESLIDEYNKRLDYLKLLQSKINQKVEVAKEQIKQVSTPSAKQEIIEKVKDSENDELFSEEEFNTEQETTEVRNDVQEEVREEVAQPVIEQIIQKPTLQEFSKPIEKAIENIEDWLKVGFKQYLSDNLNKLTDQANLFQDVKGNKGDNTIVSSIIKNYDEETFNKIKDDEVDFAAAKTEVKKLLRLLKNVETTPVVAPIIKQVEVIEAKVEVQESRDSSKELVNFIEPMTRVPKANIESALTTYIESIQKSNKVKNDVNAVKDATDYIVKKFNIDRTPRNEYNLAIKISNLFLDLTRLDRYNEEIKTYEAKIEALSAKVEATIEPILEVQKEELVKQEIPAVEEKVIENIDSKKVEKVERDFQNEIFSDRVEYVAEKNGDINPDYLEMLDSNFLNIGDEITLERQADNDTEAEGWRKENPLSSKNLVIRVKKGEKTIGFVTQNLIRLKKFSNENDIQYSERLSRIENLEETKQKQEQLDTLRKIFFSLPETYSLAVKVNKKSSGFHKKTKTRRLSSTDLLQDNDLQFVLADSGTEGQDVQLRNKTSNDYLNKETIDNINLLEGILKRGTLFMSYPSAISNKVNLVPIYVNTIEKDFDLLSHILNGVHQGDKSVTDFVKNNLEAGYEDISKSGQLESFINQYFGYVYNNKTIDNYDIGLAVLEDGNIKIKVGDKVEVLKKGKQPKEFYSLLKEWMKKTNKNITIASDTKNYASGINQDSKFRSPILKDGKLDVKINNNYNEYVSDYVNTELSYFESSPNGKRVYYTAPIYQYDISEAILKAKQATETKIEIVEEIKTEEPKIDSERLNRRKNINKLKNNLNNNLDHIHSKEGARQVLFQLQKLEHFGLKVTSKVKREDVFEVSKKFIESGGGRVKLLNTINTLNKEEFNSFPVILLIGDRVGISQSVLSVYQKQGNGSTLDANIVHLFKQIQATPLSNDKKLVAYKRLSNIKTEQEFGQYLKEYCN